jgi:Superinfection immunity protein
MATRRITPARGVARLHREPDYSRLPCECSWLIWIIWAVFFVWHPFLALYLLPSAINFSNHHPESMRNLALNIFFGWTPFWIVFICTAISNIGNFPRREDNHEHIDVI